MANQTPVRRGLVAYPSKTCASDGSRWRVDAEAAIQETPLRTASAGRRIAPPDSPSDSGKRRLRLYQFRSGLRSLELSFSRSSSTYRFVRLRAGFRHPLLSS